MPKRTRVFAGPSLFDEDDNEPSPGKPSNETTSKPKDLPDAIPSDDMLLDSGVITGNEENDVGANNKEDVLSRFKFSCIIQICKKIPMNFSRIQRNFVIFVQNLVLFRNTVNEDYVVTLRHSRLLFVFDNGGRRCVALPSTNSEGKISSGQGLRYNVVEPVVDQGAPIKLYNSTSC